MGLLSPKPIVRAAVVATAFLASFAAAPLTFAQAPTLSMAKAYVGITNNSSDHSNSYTLEMDKPDWPRGVTSGELIVVPTSWPNNRPPTWSDDKSNTWNAAFSPVCQDSTGIDHGFYYVANAAAGTSRLTQRFTAATSDTFADWMHFYNVATSNPVDQKSCKTGVIPTSNTAPNISGTPFTTTANNDLIVTCVFDESKPLGVPNDWSSITWPVGFVGLSDEPNLGHACAYAVQATAGSFTPTFTVSQSTHDRFTITSVAFKAGSGGSAPSNGASILLSELQYIGAGGQVVTVSLPCPAFTTAIVVRDEGRGISSVTDSQGNLYTSPTFQDSANIFYVNNPGLSPSMTVSLNTNTSGGWTLVELDCLGNTAGVDTGATASNGSTLNGAGQGAAYNNGTPSATGCTGYSFCVNNQSSITPSVSGDLILDAVPDGNGPVQDCNQNASMVCVFDYGSSTSWSGQNKGDQQSYSNGDGMAHYYASTASPVGFNFGMGTANGVVSQAIAFKASSGGVGGGPSISNLSPTSGAVGSTVTITGTNFGATQGSSTVTFGGTAATVFSGWSATSIGVTVPAGASTGNVVVTVSGVPSNGVSFTVLSTPAITNVSPTSGAVGSTVTITGTNFGASRGTSTVTFGGTAATVFSGWSATSIGVTVPAGASTGNVVVTVSGVPSNGVSFTVLSTPTITNVSPTSGAVGSTVTITGTNFGATQGSSTVSFGGTAATVFSGWSATSIGVTVPAGASTGNVVVTISGVPSNGVSFTVLSTPAITNVSPTSGAVGSTVTITGTNFGASRGTSTVTFGGTAATVFSGWTATSIGVTVPTGASTGNVVVTVSGVPSNGVSFTVLSAPTITNVSPTSGAVGSTVTITGTNFGATQGSSTVSFGGTAATVFSGWSATSIGVTVPAGASTGNVVVTVSGVPSNGVSFTVLSAPTITNVSPTSGAVGSTVTITGTNFGASQGSSAVSFGGTAATVFSSWSATSIGVTVPAGASTGNVVVTVSGVPSNGVSFTVLSTPTITNVSPTSGAVGSTVTITGTNFGATQGSSTVSFGGTAATVFSSWSATSIGVTVPAGASTGNVVVTVSGVPSNGVSFTVLSTPTITNVSPTSGAVGSTVTITGTNFGTTQGSSAVSFGGTAATVFSSWSATSIGVTVPAGASTGNVVVTVSGVPSNGVSFTVTSTQPSTPTLSMAKAYVGVSSNYSDHSNSYTLEMDKPGWPRGVTSGELIVVPTSWPNSSAPTWSDDKSNTWNSVFSPVCQDSTGVDHGFYYVANAAAGTSRLTQRFAAATSDTFADWMHFYNVAISSPVDQQSCRTGVTPTNNTAPNISGTPYTTTASNDLIITCVFAESKPLGPQNPWNSITWPVGFTGLSDEPNLGHACAYAVQGTAGSFTPTFTVSQTTHDRFTITSVAFRAGSGGSAPSNGASILLSELQYAGAGGQVVPVSLPCPAYTTAIVVRDEAKGVSSVTDSLSNLYTSPTFQDTSNIYYVNNPGTNPSMTVSLHMNTSGSGTLIELDCLGNTAGVDTGATASNGATLNGAGQGATFNNGTPSATGCTGYSFCVNNQSSITPSVSGDLILDAIPDGNGPVQDCNQNASMVCVFDYGSSTSWSGPNNGDQQSYSNGDGMAHYYASTAAPVSFNFGMGTANGVVSQAIAFKPSSAGTGPSISNLSPTSGTVGTTVTITGTNFGASEGSSTVTFGGTAATVFSSWSATSIGVTVPAGANTGNVIVTVSGVPSNGVSFTVLTAPTITNVSPTSGPVGTSVTITGTNFGATQGSSTVTFSGTAATVFSSWSATSISVTVPAGAITGNVVVTVSGLPSNGVGFTVTPPPTPTVTNVSPTSGTVGTTVTITGTNFGSSQGSSTVTFGGTAATVFSSWSATSIGVTVPVGANTGNVVVTVFGVPSNGVSFTVIPSPTPTITNVSPTSGPVGTPVTITGTNFGASRGSSTVTFGGTAATVFSSWSATSIGVTVPAGANTGNVVVTVSGVPSNGVSFTVIPTPTISNVSPTSGVVGTTVTITGTNFGATQGSSTVSFGGTAATVFSSWSATSIAVKVPAGATTGNVVVTVSGVPSNGVNFTVVSGPTITNVSPTSGPVGTSVTITGTNFGASRGSSTVTFGGTAATTFSSWGATSIGVTVPTGANTGNVVVTVSGVPSNGVTFTVTTMFVTLSPKRAAVTLSQSQQFTATVNNDPLNGGVSWSVDGISGGNSVVGTISSTGLFTPGTQPRVHTVTATSNDNNSVSASSTIAITDLTGIYTYHNDTSRTGQNLQEYALTTSSVNPSTFGLLFSCAVDGGVYTQPLYVANFNIGGQTRNVMFIATEHDSVYAFDADSPSCVILWKTSFLSSGVTTVPAGDTGETRDIVPEIGITSTPVIDPSTNTIYVVAKTKETVGTGCSSANPCYVHRLHALDLTNGTEKFGGPVVISAPNFVPLFHLQRPALLLNNGTVYIGFGSHGDNNVYQGWLMAYSASTLAQQWVWHSTDPTGGQSNQGALWGSGNGPAVDASGNIYVETANGVFDGVNNFSDSVIKLSPAGAMLDSFTPLDQGVMQQNDLDLGSGDPIILPDAMGSATHPHVMIAQGKTGVVYLLDQTNLGGYHTGSNRDLGEVSVAVNGFFGQPAYWNGSIYTTAGIDNLRQFTISNGTISTTPSSSSPNGFPLEGGTPSVSASGTTNGIVWAADVTAAYQGTGGPVILDAYDATNVSTWLYSSPSSGSGKAVVAIMFTTPAVANGKVYVVGQNGFTVFGLLPN